MNMTALLTKTVLTRLTATRIEEKQNDKTRTSAVLEIVPDSVSEIDLARFLRGVTSRAKVQSIEGSDCQQHWCCSQAVS